MRALAMFMFSVSIFSATAKPIEINTAIAGSASIAFQGCLNSEDGNPDSVAVESIIRKTKPSEAMRQMVRDTVKVGSDFKRKNPDQDCSMFLLKVIDDLASKISKN